jgi:hypothetical protein
MANLDYLTVEVHPSEGKQLSEPEAQHTRSKDQ